MESIFIAGTLLIFLIIALSIGVWVFAGLLAVALGGMIFLGDFSVTRTAMVAKSVIWKSANTWELAAIPLFLWMGEIIFRSDISERLFRGLAPLVEWLPGRLLHTNIMGCTLFAAVSGSTSATTATVGKITLSALQQRGYNESLALGSLAGAGSLGLLIPPSIILIIYGILAEVSIARLFAAGVIPGLMVSFLFSSYIIIKCLLNPSFSPRNSTHLSIKTIFFALVDLLPIASIIVVVLGGIYSGLVTPSEAAAVGVLAAIILTLLTKKLTFGLLFESLIASVRTSCMVCSILIAAALLSTAIGFLHVPKGLSELIAQMNLSTYSLLFILALMYIVLGLFLDGISILVMTMPIVLPIVINAGIDPLWFGIFLVLLIEMGQITPPVGFNLFIIQGITNKNLYDIVRFTFPFFLLLILALIILTIQPKIVTFLANMV